MYACEVKYWIEASLSGLLFSNTNAKYLLFNRPVFKITWRDFNTEFIQQFCFFHFAYIVVLTKSWVFYISFFIVLFLSILGSEVAVILFWTGVNCRAYHFSLFSLHDLKHHEAWPVILMTEVNVWLVNFTVRPDLPFPDETHRCFDKPIVARLPCVELKCGVIEIL